MDAALPRPVIDNVNDQMLSSIVERYPDLIHQLAAAKPKGMKPGGQSLSSLDFSRHQTIPDSVGSRHIKTAQPEYANLSKPSPEQSKDNAELDSSYGWIDLHELKELMEWKLLRGTFRPTLRGLIASNLDQTVKETTEEAFRIYGRGKGSPSQANKDYVLTAVKKLCVLKGVGPATASLILSVAFPQSVPFFSDELYTWAVSMKGTTQKEFDVQVSGKQKISLKYTEKEYVGLFKAVSGFRGKFAEARSVSAQDVEKAAFVILRADAPATIPSVARESKIPPKVVPFRESTGSKRKRGNPSVEVEDNAKLTSRRTLRPRK